jgi:hypothetical protein
VSEIVFLLEEPSAEAMLEGLLPKILPHGTRHRCLVFEGKQDLEKQMVRRMRGYRVPGAKFVILRDKDSGDCRNIKQALVVKCAEAGRPNALVRIACHELESWYLADLAAVGKGLHLPNDHPSPYQTLKQIAPSYQKVGGSRAIGPHLDPFNQRSHSFSIFVAGLQKLCAP